MLKMCQLYSRDLYSWDLAKITSEVMTSDCWSSLIFAILNYAKNYDVCLLFACKYCKYLMVFSELNHRSAAVKGSYRLQIFILSSNLAFLIFRMECYPSFHSKYCSSWLGRAILTVNHTSYSVKTLYIKRTNLQ